MHDEQSAPERFAERLRQVLAAPVALLSTLLGIVCVVSVPDVVATVDDLALVDDRFVGWAGVGAALGVALAAGSLLAVERIGSGPALSIGTGAAVFGLALGHQVVQPLQLMLAGLLLGVAVGCLLAGGASMTFELPAASRRAVMAAWSVPLAAAWPLLAWTSRHSVALADQDAPRLTHHPAVWLFAPVAVVIVVWSALTMLLEPPRSGLRSGPVWESAWSALLATALGGSVAIMALGFDRDLPVGWLRPLVICVAGVVVGSIVAVTKLLPAGWTRIGYVCVAFVMVTFPVTMQLLVMTTDGGNARIAWWMAAVLTVAVLLGSLVGARRPDAVSWALLLVAAACAGCWVMPDTQGWLAAGALPLCLGAGAVFGTGLRHLASTAAGWRFGAMAMVAMTVLGTATGVAVSWALGGDLPADTDSARAAGRVFLGVMFALAVMGSAAVHVLSPRVADQTGPGDLRRAASAG